ncbi:hypothetical protein ACWDUN_15190 [Mycobacterium sp. NPDC003323]
MNAAIVGPLMASTGGLGAVQAVTAPAVAAVQAAAPAGAVGVAGPGAAAGGGTAFAGIPGVIAPAAGAAQGIPGLVMAPLAGVTGVLAEMLPQPSLGAPSGIGGVTGMLPTPQLNMPNISGLGVPVPSQVSMPTDMVCEGVGGWSLSTPGTDSVMPDATAAIRSDDW